MISAPARSVLLFLFSFAITVHSSAQSDVVSQPIQWFAFTSLIKVSSRVSVLEEGHFRYAGSFDPLQSQYRTGLDISLPNGFSVMPIGYVYTWNSIYGKQPASYANNEHRLFEQVAYKHSIGRAGLTHRVRLEQRFIQVHSNENGEVVDKGYDLYVNRFRYRIQANLPISKDQAGSTKLYLTFYDELFIDFGKSVTYTDPDQNRVFAGLGYQFDKKVSMQGGFLYQYLVKMNGVQAEKNIGVQVQVGYNLDLTKQ